MKKDIDGIIKKRHLIEQTRKSVLFWVGGAACVLGIMVVVAGILVQNLLFNNKVIGMKNETLHKIEKNIAVVPDLNADVSVLNTNEQLSAVRVNTDTPVLQSILDALPADANRLAMGASLQQKIFNNIPGLTVESLSVDPSDGSSVQESSGASTGDLGQMAFSASISGTPDALKQALQHIERSIRAINVQTINGTSTGQNVSLQITGVAYYLPPADLNLTTMKVKD